MTINTTVILPGEYIRDEIEARGWTQVDLADVMGRPVTTVNQIINGKREITIQTAQELAAAFGTSAELWANLESQYRLDLSRTDNSKVEKRAKLYDILPVSELVKRGWLEKHSDIAETEKEILAFLGRKSFDVVPEFACAARKGTSYGEMTWAQAAWLCRLTEIAKTVPASTFSVDKLDKHLDELHSLTVSDQETRKVPAVLAKMGIRFVVIEHLPKTKIDGFALWLSKSKPVVAMSMRYDRIDGFWHTLAHELSHIRHRDNAPIDDNIVGAGAKQSVDAMEVRANQEASDWLIPSEKLESFISRTKPRFSKQRINQFANLHKIHPGIVVGQLQFRKAIDYRHSREMLVRVRGIVTEFSVTDGWGHTG